MTRHEVYYENVYFEWLYYLICDERRFSKISYKKLFVFLHRKPFRWRIPKDENRAEDGIDLRYRFACEYDYDTHHDTLRYLTGPCSMLEMMIALAIRCEENIMGDPEFGDRTRQWFWEMVVNLGLSSMVDERFNRDLAEENVERFLDRRYEPDGRGGLFRIRHCDEDVRNIEIWHQLCWYLDSIS